MPRAERKSVQLSPKTYQMLDAYRLHCIELTGAGYTLDDAIQVAITNENMHEEEMMEQAIRSRTHSEVLLSNQTLTSLGMLATSMAFQTGKSVEISEVIEELLSQNMELGKSTLLSKVLTPQVKQSYFADPAWTNFTVSDEAAVTLDGKLVNLFEQNYVAIRAERLGGWVAKIVVLNKQDGSLVSDGEERPIKRAAK